jgi:hypothetical protein
MLGFSPSWGPMRAEMVHCLSLSPLSPTQYQYQAGTRLFTNLCGTFKHRPPRPPGRTNPKGISGRDCKGIEGTPEKYPRWKTEQAVDMSLSSSGIWRWPVQGVLGELRGLIGDEGGPRLWGRMAAPEAVLFIGHHKTPRASACSRKGG